MMSEIYRDCDSIVVWLGSATTLFREAAELFSQKPKMRDLRVVLRDEYFTRLWIVQEILLARQVRAVCRGMTGVSACPGIECVISIWVRQSGCMSMVIPNASFYSLHCKTRAIASRYFGASTGLVVTTVMIHGTGSTAC